MKSRFRLTYYKLPAFQPHVHVLAETANLDALDPFVACELMNDLFREAEIVASANLRRFETDTVEVKMQTLCISARIVSRCDVRLARKILHYSDIIQASR